MVKTLSHALVLTLAFSASLVQGQQLRDPTQPPAAYIQAGSDKNLLESGSDQQVKYVLQSVIRRHGAKPAAMINGQMLRVGEKIDDYVLVKLTEAEATLKGEAGKEILAMSPSVDKKNLRQSRSGR